MKRIIILLLFSMLSQQRVVCPLHTYAVCYNTYLTSPTGSGAVKWHCSCGDDVWVLPQRERQSDAEVQP